MASLVRQQTLQQTALLEQKTMKCFTVHNASPVTTSSSSSKVHGNVHTGATPPWLRQDEEEEDNDAKEPDCTKMCHSGPYDEEQFKQHKEHVIHSKLNPKRVGAN